MLPDAPPGWEALQKRAREAKTSEEFSGIIAEINALLDRHEASSAREPVTVAGRNARHGDHICVFYKSSESLLDFLVTYYAEGVMKGEYCFGAQKPEVREVLLSRLRSVGKEVKAAVDRGAVEILELEKVYFADKSFRPLAMMEMLDRTKENIKSRGFTGLRTAGDMT